MFAHGLALLLALTPVIAAPPAERLVWSTDYAATAQAMSKAGHGDLAAGRTFLAFDPAGDGRAVEVVGDLSTADRVVVLVPGNDTTVRDFDRGLGGVTRRAPAVQARTIYNAARRHCHDHVRDSDVGAHLNRTRSCTRVAVVAWLGYDPPEGIGLAAIRQDRAAFGAVELRRFVATLGLDKTVIVVGHSYGTVVVGLAAHAFGPHVTDVVALASPGMGVTEWPGNARLWAATAADDWIRRVPHLTFAGFGHGADPTEPDFGAHIMPTTGVSGHDAYLVPGSSTLDALAWIITGQALPSPSTSGSSGRPQDMVGIFQASPCYVKNSIRRLG